jgi:predicted hydrolase (HD superfamily)
MLDVTGVTKGYHNKGLENGVLVFFVSTCKNLGVDLETMYTFIVHNVNQTK